MENRAANLQLGLQILAGLAVLTVVEYVIAVTGIPGGLFALVVISLGKVALILTAFMHVSKVFQTKQATTGLAHAAHDLAAKVYSNRMGLWLFIFSDSIVFLAFLASRYYILGTSRPLEVNQPLGLFLTCLLLASSFFANRADVHVSHGDNKKFQNNILITIVLGIAFLCLVVLVEWPEAMRFAPPGTPFGTALFSLTGLHSVHILSGLIILAVAFFKSRRNGYSEKDHWGAEAAAIYWHFVDVVWVFIYITLYLVS